jgi:hypothetical protein
MGNIVMAQGGIPIQQGIYEDSVTKKAELGRLLPFADGRCFRYCKAGGSIAHGLMCSASLVVAADNTVTQTGMAAQAIGKKVINVLLGGATTKNLYEDGLLTIEDSTGQGYTYRIKSNKAGGDAVATPCELTLYDPLVAALAAGSIITLTMNKHKNVIINPSGTEAAVAIGVPLIDITTAAAYFWAQTKGYVALRITTATTIGQLVSFGAADGDCNVATGTVHPNWGICVQIGSSGNYAVVDLQLE